MIPPHTTNEISTGAKKEIAQHNAGKEHTTPVDLLGLADTQAGVTGEMQVHLQVHPHGMLDELDEMLDEYGVAAQMHPHRHVNIGSYDTFSGTAADWVLTSPTLTLAMEREVHFDTSGTHPQDLEVSPPATQGSSV